MTCHSCGIEAVKAGTPIDGSQAETDNRPNSPHRLQSKAQEGDRTELDGCGKIADKRDHVRLPAVSR